MGIANSTGSVGRPPSAAPRPSPEPQLLAPASDPARGRAPEREAEACQGRTALAGAAAILSRWQIILNSLRTPSRSNGPLKGARGSSLVSRPLERGTWELTGQPAP
jgi:hypothetical protein